MSSAISRFPYMGIFAILLMTMRLEAVNAIMAWDCSDNQHKMSTVYFKDLSDTELVQSSTTLGAQYPDEFAYKFMKGPGYIAIMEKDKFHIIQCKPVLAVLQPQHECYDRLQITKNNQKLFLTPWTHVIAKSANWISCDAPNLIDYVLEAITYKVVPRPEGSLNPNKVNPQTQDSLNPVSITKLKPETKLTWKYHELKNLATGGIYTEEQFAEAWDRMRHPEYYQNPIVWGQPIPEDTTKLFQVIYPNKPEIPWYKHLNLFSVLIIIAVLLFGIISCVFIVMMIVGHIKYGSAVHLFKRGNRFRRQKKSDQGDLTIKRNKLDV